MDYICGLYIWIIFVDLRCRLVGSPPHACAQATVGFEATYRPFIMASVRSEASLRLGDASPLIEAHRRSARNASPSAVSGAGGEDQRSRAEFVRRIQGFVR